MILLKTDIGCMSDFWTAEELLELRELAVRDLAIRPDKLTQKALEMYETAIAVYKL